MDDEDKRIFIFIHRTFQTLLAAFELFKRQLDRKTDKTRVFALKSPQLKFHAVTFEGHTSTSNYFFYKH